MVYGYCRCSTNETKQDVTRQRNELIAAGVNEYQIVMEYEHGTAETKQKQKMLFDMVRSGDEIVVTEVSRITRSVKQLCEIIDMLKEKHICLRILNSVTIDCRSGDIDGMTQAFLQMAGVFAELERKLISDRTKSGMANAKAKGKQIGRKQTTKDDIPDVFYKHYPAYLRGDLNKVQLARVCGLTRPTIYKYIELVQK